MKVKKVVAVLSVIALVAVVGLTVAGTALAQTETPQSQVTPETPRLRLWGRGFGFGGGGSTAIFDKVAEALGLTPTQLFEELHSGKTIEELATEKGIDLQTIQDAVSAQKTQAMKDAIEQAVTDGTITRAQADWLLQGLDNGYLNKGFGFGHGGRGMRGFGGVHGFGGFHGFGKGDITPPAQSTPAPGTSS